jgi:hypothetical protein
MHESTTPPLGEGAALDIEVLAGRRDRYSDTASAENGQPHFTDRWLDPRQFADVHGPFTAIERCRRCGVAGLALYARDGWGFTPQGACGDPLRCGDRPNLNGGSLLLLDGGRP